VEVELSVWHLRRCRCSARGGVWDAHTMSFEDVSRVGWLGHERLRLMNEVQWLSRVRP
jgi:hypothetical protein